jgi:type I restriction enzyme S subunit
MEKVLLTSICRPKQWKTISTKDLLDSGYPVYGANGKIGFYNSYTHENPTVLITCRGATCGSINISDPKSYVNGNAMALDNLSKQVDLYYLKYYLEYRKLDDVISGSAQPQITGKGLSKVKIPLPPLDQQKKIAAILDAADTYRQKTKALISKYDELTQSLFLDMFGDTVSNPKGWETKTIEQLVKKQKYSLKRGPFGGALKKEIFVKDGYLVYEKYHALNNYFSMARYFIDEKKYKELIGFAVNPKDIIISCSGVYLGKLAIIPENAREGIINQALLKVTLDESKVRNDFFVFHFTQQNFKQKYFDSNRGAGVPNFPPMKVFKQFPFISPPIELQNKFAERVKAIEAQKAQAQASLAQAEDLFNSLLQRAFKGELVS